MRYLLIILILYSCNADYKTASPIAIPDTISTATLNLSDSMNASIEELDSLKPEVKQAIANLKHYQQLKDHYSKQEAEIIYKPITDSSTIIALRRKLKEANNEIARLNGELSVMAYRRNIPETVKDVSALIQPAIETPDDNSIVITLNGRSNKGNIPTENLTIYLIPYSRKTKSLMKYDSSCNELYATIANYYNGVYFFNNVQEGKYIIKVCTYFGNYKLIKKQEGKQSITMQVSPPIQ